VHLRAKDGAPPPLWAGVWIWLALLLAIGAVWMIQAWSSAGH